MTDSNDKLDKFYSALKQGLHVGEFLRQYDEIKSFVHSQGLTEDYRLARGRAKRLNDEVAPVARFVRKHAQLTDQISFSMDNQYPDCVVDHESGHKREVEVTIVQGKERFFLASELNADGTGRGFIGITDDADIQQFEEAMERDREAYTTEEVIGCVERAIELSAQKKRLHRGDTLLIEAPHFLLLPSDRWTDHWARFEDKVKDLCFSAVFLTGYGVTGDVCQKIK